MQGEWPAHRYHGGYSHRLEASRPEAGSWLCPLSAAFLTSLGLRFLTCEPGTLTEPHGAVVKPREGMLPCLGGEVGHTL